LDALLAKEGKEVDARVYAEIDEMRAEDAEAVLARLEEVNLSKVTNTSSFLSSIVRRVKDEGSSDLTRCLDVLPRPLRHSFMRLMDEGRLRKGDLESRVATALRVRAELWRARRAGRLRGCARMRARVHTQDMPVELAQAAVDSYANSRLDTVRSKTGFFIGISACALHC
jgi:hypothetical protein